jgi:succinyl-CoA synthetase alpha subunit
MSVLVDDETRVVVQGITGGEGKFHAEQMMDYGTNVVAGAVPDKGGQEVAGVPIYDTVDEAAREEDADASVVFVPPAFAADAIFEALDTSLDLVVAITEGIPTQDMSKVPIIGTDFIDALELFENDPDTEAVVMCGEIGGEDEEQAARYIAENTDTPVAGFIAGRTAPPGKRMGHAGAIVSGSGTGTAESKIDALNDAGVPVGDTPNEVAEYVEDFL